MGSPPLTRGKEPLRCSSSSISRITPAYAGKSVHFAQMSCHLRDHPRLRGEKGLGLIVAGGAGGSPPLTRGKGLLYRQLRAVWRITPAYAGKRIVDGDKTLDFEDHPRLRGEKYKLRLHDMTFMGSPPLTRGKAWGGGGGAGGWRITPAYAGKSRYPYRWNGRSKDHPRLRGEKYTLCPSRENADGSPPLTRGKACPTHFRQPQSGITPAYAGKSGVPRFSLGVCRDHPRLRGEKQNGNRHYKGWGGSPPLTRGKGAWSPRAAQGGRITPAYAGKRHLLAKIISGVEDHPRLRGEKQTQQTAYQSQSGSPPLTRGKGTAIPCTLSRRRITPAYAGKSVFWLAQKEANWDHPRLRGEKFRIRLLFRMIPGSPPLTRGKAHKIAGVQDLRRITPAYAGKSPEFPARLASNPGSPPLTRGKEAVKTNRRHPHGITPAYAGKSP